MISKDKTSDADQASEARGPQKQQPKARNPFMAARDAWLATCNADPDLPKSCFKVHYAIADFSSVREAGYSWLSYQAIGKRTGMSESAIRRAVAASTARGFMHVVSGGDRRKPNQYWPLLNGTPLAGSLPLLPSKSAVVSGGQLPPKSAVERKPRDAATGKFATANIGGPLPPKSEPDNRQNRQSSLLIELPNVESPKAADGPTDNERRELKKRRDSPATQSKAALAFKALDVEPSSAKELCSIRRGIVELEADGMSFWEDILPAIQTLASRGEIPRFVNCTWMESEVVSEIILARHLKAESGRVKSTAGAT